jgi:hypothetical protein
MDRYAEAQPCPFCGKRFRRYERVMEHIERRHTDNSGFVVRERPGAASQASTPSPLLPPLPPRRPAPVPTQEVPQRPTRAPPVPPVREIEEWEGEDGTFDDGDEDLFVSCPLEECGEMVLSSDITEHIELHQAEQFTLDDNYLTADQHHQHPNGAISSRNSSSSDASYPRASKSYYAPVSPASGTMSSATSVTAVDSTASYRATTIS